MEYLIFAVIFYFILQTAGNLVYILRGGGQEPAADSAEADAAQPAHDWRGPSPREHTGRQRGQPTFWGEDVEDVTWQDVE
jgi:hypothetical protein